MKDKLVAEGLYDRETCDMMSDAEAKTLWRLHREIGSTFDAVCEAYAAIIGLATSRLSYKQRTGIANKVAALIDDYDGAYTDGRYAKEKTPSTALTACLRRHHELDLEISNIHDNLSTRRH